MNFIKVLKDDLAKGYSKSDLEKLIGLPQNCLSGVIKGDKKLSRKSEIKIAEWEASEKPNPLSVFFVKKKHSDKIIKPDNSNNSGEPVTVTIKAKDHYPLDKKVQVRDLTKQTHLVKPITEKKPTTNYSINTSNIPPMPVKLPGENSFDYAERKNEWKIKYNTK